MFEFIFSGFTFVTDLFNSCIWLLYWIAIIFGSLFVLNFLIEAGKIVCAIFCPEGKSSCPTKTAASFRNVGNNRTKQNIRDCDVLLSHSPSRTDRTRLHYREQKRNGVSGGSMQLSERVLIREPRQFQEIKREPEIKHESSDFSPPASAPLSEAMGQASTTNTHITINNVVAPPWSNDEELFLWSNKNQLSMKEIAEKLHRTESACDQKLRKLKNKWKDRWCEKCDKLLGTAMGLEMHNLRVHRKRPRPVPKDPEQPDAKKRKVEEPTPSKSDTDTAASNADKLDWSVKQVSKWMCSLGSAYRAYAPKFESSGINGHILNALDEGGLGEIVASKLHRTIITSEWNAL